MTLEKTTRGRPAVSVEVQNEIKRLIAEGYNIKSIARHLEVSTFTVRKYKGAK
ncbi:helix-turn-helix domain-containing protein [Vibrio vulnificus]|uniref:helix-turn-helix domain-containing protein n=1 Tax=Vibrio vulnificus TaxID=672 RepID=UPI0028C8E954|nr:response regulator transcription factor [Vibrio parahaemolyticus]HDY7968039.1 response regulator transcription factor [Vibrio vulnificus]